MGFRRALPWVTVRSMSVASATRSRVRDDLTRIVHRRLTLPELARDIRRPLHRAVPFDGVCLLTLDPATLLPTGEFVEGGLPPSDRARMTEIELGEPDFNKFSALAGAPTPAASLSAATSGDLERSTRQREVRRPNGFADELRATLRGPTGSWGTLTLLRGTSSPDFTDTEVRYVASLAPTLSEGIRRTMLHTDAASHEPSSDTGFMVLTADDAVEMANHAAEAWIADLSPADRGSSPLPVAVRAIAAQTRRIDAGDGSGVLSSARVHTRRGHWLVIRGSIVGENRVAVLIEPARPSELATAIVDTYGFTERERRITELVAHGLSTKAIAERLHIAPYTVQDHLKAVFDKSGTSSRGELIARLFFDHQALRLGPHSQDT